MEDKKTYQELPDRVVMPLARVDADAAIRRAIREVQGAWSGLKGAAELHPLPTELSGITIEWLNGIIDRRMAKVKNDESLTEDERAQRLTKWRTLKARCARYVHTITNVVAAWPGVWEFDPVIQTFFVPDIDSVVEAAVTKDTPDEAREHWRMIQEALAQVRTLRDWENAHDIITTPLHTFESMPPVTFAELWASGDVKFDRSFRHLGINPQNPPYTIF